MHCVCSPRVACSSPNNEWQGDFFFWGETSARARLGHDDPEPCRPRSRLTRAKDVYELASSETLGSSLSRKKPKSTLKRELNPPSDAADTYADSLGPVRHHCERAEQLRA